MKNVLVYTPNANTKSLYHQNLTKLEWIVYPATDLSQFLLILAGFPIDTIIIVDELDNVHEMDMIFDVLERKYSDREIIQVSPFRRPGKKTNHFSTSREFFDSFL